MSLTTCHSPVQKSHRGGSFTIALSGNPNVGKSTIFNTLTGLDVSTANYPGKTVTLNTGSSVYRGRTFGVIDLPGTYSLGSVSEDQFVARQEILEGHADVVPVIVDATNLERNLYLVLQLIDLGYPIVVGCNLMDAAMDQNLVIDTTRLAVLLGVPVIPMTAATSEGIDTLIAACVDVMDKTVPPLPRTISYGPETEGYIRRIARSIGMCFKSVPFGLTPRAFAILLLEEDVQFQEILRETPDGKGVVKVAHAVYADILEKTGLTPSAYLIRERHRLQESVVRSVQKRAGTRVALSTKLWKISLNPFTGLPILLGGLISVFMVLYRIGSLLSAIMDRFWATFISPVIQATVYGLAGHTPLARTILWGADAGVQATLDVGIPYVLTFYLILAFLEDSGYLNSIAFLTDSLMHKVGLHGRSVIPIIAGAGCNVPAITGTRVLTTRREKVIACTLITLVPCSARTAIIMGAAAFYLGWPWAIAIYLIDFAVGLIAGRSLAALLPGKSPGLVMEMFPFRVPRSRIIIKKTWFRLREFLSEAMPIILVGSVILGGLYETNLIWFVTAPFNGFMEHWLGLPSIAGICLLFGILRKELALQLLVSLAIMRYGASVKNLQSFMTREQIFVFALVTTLYVPCLATIMVLTRELGRKTALAITVGTIVMALTLGGMAHFVLIRTHLLS